MLKIRCLIFKVFLMVFLTQGALGGQRIVLRKPLPVYDQPDLVDGSVIKTLRKGAGVEITASQTGFMQVTWKEANQVKTGYSLYDDINQNLDQPLQAPETHGEVRGSSYLGSVSLAYFGSTHAQGARVTSLNGTNNEISSVKGFTSFPELRLDFYVAEQWALRGGLSLRQAQLSGTIKSTADGSTASPFELKQTFSSWSLGARYFMDGRDAWWVGGGYESAKVTDATLYVDSSKSSADLEKPNYNLISGNFGYNFNFSSWVLGLETKMGIVLNTKPNLLLADFGLSGGYRF